ncbi:MAG TPA: hypothetical protein PLY88_01580 [Candidatus Omnitrophota bacterium]|nr:hypothetical protein [Candidatus Omnitrophota bacterium]HRK61225.1 hypothetical protein [Candidatus Omnitrophota bacterium]
MKFKFAFLLSLALMLSSLPCFAGESYAHQFNTKFQRGVVNTLLGWSKVFTVPYEKSNQDPNAWATVARGLYEGVGNTVAGVFNTVFSPTPLKELAYPGGGVLES